jgi:hypothetical protein
MFKPPAQDEQVGGGETFWSRYFEDPTKEASPADQVAALAAEYTSGRQFQPPRVDNLDDALDVALHVMAKHFFQGRELEVLPLVAQMGGKIPIRTITGPNGAPVTMLKFNEELLRTIGESQFITSAPDRFFPLICFTAYAMTLHKYVNRWTATLLEVEHYKQGAGTVNLPANVPNINDPAQMKVGGTGSLVFQEPMMLMAQGIWEWPAVLPGGVSAAATAIKAKDTKPRMAAVSPGAWAVVAPLPDSKNLNTFYTETQNVDSDQVKNESIFKRLATAAYLSEVISAVYQHMMHVLRTYSEVAQTNKSRPAGAPLVADPKLLKSGGAGPGQAASCAPGTVPAFRVGPDAEDKKAFNDVTGEKLDVNDPVPAAKAISKETGTLMPGVVVDQCLPARPLSTVMGGAQPAIPVLGGGGAQQVPLPSGPMSNIFNVGGLRMGSAPFGATQVTPQQAMSAYSAQTTGFSGPLVSTFMAELSGSGGPPPGFHAVVITPPPAQ